MAIRNAEEKRTDFLRPLVVEAFKHPLRWEILSILATEQGQPLAFSQLKDRLKEKGLRLANATLSHHLKVLQMGDLIQRSVRLEDRAKNPDPYYCFYHITSFGVQAMQVMEHLWAASKESRERAQHTYVGSAT